MPFLLFVAFLLVPLLELAVISQVADAIGLGWTIAILLADSVAGAVLVRREGRRAWNAFRAAISELRWPGDEVAQGALVLVGGALLLTPGFVTDVVGLALVVPLTRALASRGLRARLRPFSSRQASRESLDVEVVSVEREDTSATHSNEPTS